MLNSQTQKLFKRNRFVAHYSYVKPGEVVPNFFNKSSHYLVRDGDTLAAKANTCLHRGMKLVAGRQLLRNGQAILCPFHKWGYSAQGQLLSTPGFDKHVEGCLSGLELEELDGRLFFERESLDQKPWTSSGASIDKLIEELARRGVYLEDYTFDQEQIGALQLGWRSYMEIFLDCYHVIPAHPMTLGSYIKGDDVEWVWGDEWSLQVNELRFDDCPTSLGFNKFKEAVRGIGWDKPWGAMFAAIYPGMTIDCYPHCVAITQLVPVHDLQTAVYVHVFFDQEVQNNYFLQNAFLDAFEETAREDIALQERLEDGWSYGSWPGYPEIKPHAHLEGALKHFADWEARQ